MKKIILSVCLAAAAFTGLAGGFQVNTQGQKALGMGGAFSAYNKDASAVFYNPAAVVMLDSGRFVSVGATLYMPNTRFLSLNTGQVTDMDDQKAYPFFFYAAIPLSDKFSAGLSVNRPFGVNTKWNDNWEGRAITQEMNFSTLYVQPTLSYKFTNNFSAGAGLVYAHGNALFRRNIGEFEGHSELTGSASGFGFNAGIYGKIQEEMSFGITYRSGVDFNIENGEAVFTDIPSSLQSQYTNQEFRTDLNMPSVLSVGFTNRITKKVLLAFEFNLTGWSSYDSLNFDFANPATPDNRAVRKYEDAMSFRLGTEYERNEKLTLRGGLYYDESPVRDEFVSPELPDGSRLGLTAGLSYKISDRLEADAAYLFEKVSERRTKADISRTDISSISGTYRTLVNGVGLGLSYKF